MAPGRQPSHDEISPILDDVQMGGEHTGPFFSFEPAGITPGIVGLSKSIGGDGLPLALTLIRPDLDMWESGAHPADRVSLAASQRGPSVRRAGPEERVVKPLPALTIFDVDPEAGRQRPQAVVV